MQKKIGGRAQKKRKKQRTASVTTAVLFFGIARVDGDATFASPRKVREDNEREEKDWINADIFFSVCVCVLEYTRKNARFWNEACVSDFLSLFLRKKMPSEQVLRSTCAEKYSTYYKLYSHR